MKCVAQRSRLRQGGFGAPTSLRFDPACHPRSHFESACRPASHQCARRSTLKLPLNLLAPPLLHRLHPLGLPPLHDLTRLTCEKQSPPGKRARASRAELPPHERPPPASGVAERHADRIAVVESSECDAEAELGEAQLLEWVPRPPEAADGEIQVRLPCFRPKDLCVRPKDFHAVAPGALHHAYHAPKNGPRELMRAPWGSPGCPWAPQGTHGPTAL